MTPEVSLLRALVAPDAAEVRRALADPRVDAARFLAFARHHHLGAFTYASLRRLDVTVALAPPLRAAAKATALLELALQDRLVERMVALAELFDAAGVRVLFLKGPLLASRFYGSVAARSAFDIDVLVGSPDDLDAADAALRRDGYEPAFRILVSRRLSRFFAHHFEYRRDGLPLDVHWALQTHPSFALDYARVWSTAVEVELAGRRFRAASAEYELVLQVLGVLTDLQVGKLTLRPLVDVIQILRALGPDADWSGLLARRRAEHVLRPTAFVLALAIEVLGRGDEFAALRAALAPTLAALPATSRAHGALLASRPLDARQKLLALRLHEAPLAASLAWWLLSLPARLAVYGVTRPAPARRAPP